MSVHGIGAEWRAIWCGRLRDGRAAMVAALAPAHRYIALGWHLGHCWHWRYCRHCWYLWDRRRRGGFLLLCVLLLGAPHAAIARDFGGACIQRRHCFGCHGVQECCVTLRGEGEARDTARIEWEKTRNSRRGCIHEKQGKQVDAE